MTSPRNGFAPRLVPWLAVALIVAAYAAMMNLKGITTDEGFRLWLINGGRALAPGENHGDATWGRVLAALSPNAYQPAWFLLQNSVMRLAHSHALGLFRSVNLAFLAVCLAGLLALSRRWGLGPRLFVLGGFSGNAYLFMHVLQIREYVAGVAFYIWSTWLVLELDRRPLAHPRSDRRWFAGYGALLTLGFYLQSWVVFPAVAQALFLLPRRAGQRRRFLAHLALSYAIVLAATVPYLLLHRQKMDVGRWASETESLESHLSHGFHLVLSGHLAGAARFPDFLFWFWPAVMAAGAFLYLWDKTSAPAPRVAEECRRQALLMVLCVAVSLAFQIGYTLLVENLAVWPRYFIIHYFFLTWLVALAFRYFWELRSAVAGWPRPALTLAAGAVAAMLVVSAAYQFQSYRRDPYLDTGQSPVSNWRNVAAGLARFLRPGDVVFTSDHITQSTLAASGPITNPVVSLADLAAADLRSAGRLVYVEPVATQDQHPEVVARLQSLGFGVVHEEPLLAPDGVNVVAYWRAVIFAKP